MAALLTSETAGLQAKPQIIWITTRSVQNAESYFPRVAASVRWLHKPRSGEAGLEIALGLGPFDSPAVGAESAANDQDTVATRLQRAQVKAKLAGLTIFEPYNGPGNPQARPKHTSAKI